MADVELTVDLTAEKIDSTAENLRKQIEQIFSVTGNRTVSPAMEGLLKQLNDAYNRSLKLEGALQKAQAGPVENPKYTELLNQEEQVVTKMKEIESEMTHVNELIDASQRKYGHSWGKLDSQVIELTTEYKKLENELKNVNAQKAVFEKGGTAYLDNTRSATEALGSNNNSIALLLRRVRELNEVPVPKNKWEELAKVSYKIGQVIGTVAKKAITFFKDKLVGAVKAAINAVKQLATNLKGITGSAIKSGMKKLATAVFGIGKSANSSNLDMKKALRTLIKYTFGVRSFYFLYRKIRKAITEGFGDLAQYSGEVNNKVSQVSTSLLYLRNAIITAFAPIVNFVAPIVSSFLDMLTRLTTNIGQFFAALLGATSFVRAKKVYKDYSEDLQKSESAQQAKQEAARKKFEENEDKRYEKYLKQKAKKEKKWQEKQLKQRQKYERQLMGFDDVNILKEQEKEEKEEMDPFERKQYEAPLTAQDLKKPWEDFRNMFETVKIDAKFKELADKIKGFFKNQDWDGLGKFLASGINKAFKIADKLITSKKLLKRIDTVISGIVGTLNSLVKNVKWSLIGKTIGDFINLVLHSFNRLLTEINWYQIGKSISDGLNSLVSTIHWDEVGQFFANKLNAIVGLFYGFVHNFHWVELGQALGTAVNNFFLNIHWTDIAHALADAINGVFAVLYGLATTIRWEEIAISLTDAFITFINNVHWNDIQTTLGALFDGVLRFINTVLDRFPFGQLGTILGKGINSIFLNTDWNSLASTFAKLVNRIFDFLRNLATTIEWSDIASKLTEALNTFLDETDWEDVGETVYEFFTGVLDFLSTALEEFDWVGLGEDILDFLKGIDWLDLLEKLFDTIGDAVTGVTTTLATVIGGFMKDKVYEASDWAKKEIKKKGMFGFVVGIFEAIADSIVNIGDYNHNWFKQYITDPFIEAFAKAMGGNNPEEVKEFNDIGKMIMEGILAGLDSVNPLYGAAKAVTKIIDSIKDLFGINSPAKTMIPIGENVSNGLLVGIKNIFNTVNSWLKTNVFDKFMNSLLSLFGLGSTPKTKQPGDKTGKGFLTGVKDSFNSVNSWIKTNVFDRFMNGLKSAFGISGSVANKVLDIGKSIIGGIKSGISNNWNNLSTYASRIPDKLHSILGKGRWSDIGENIIDGIESGISSGWRWLSNKVWNLAEDLLDTAKRALGIASPSKAFRDAVGKMIPAGLAVGIDSNASSAIKSIEQLSNDLTNTASKQIKLPPIAAGQVIPYSIGKANVGQTNDTLNKVLDMLEYNQNQGITMSELEASLEYLFRRFLNIQFYLSDEQIARHANAGNERLDRRFNPSIT